jgi:hypothetical protein
MLKFRKGCDHFQFYPFLIFISALAFFFSSCDRENSIAEITPEELLAHIRILSDNLYEAGDWEARYRTGSYYIEIILNIQIVLSLG